MPSTGLEETLRAVLGALAPTAAPAASSYEYYADFFQSGRNKAKHVVEDLLALAEKSPERLDLRKCAYLSIGGADGTEIEYVMKNTPIQYGVLSDFSPELSDPMRQKQQALAALGKTLEVRIGDISQQITTCKNQLLQWRGKGWIQGLVCSAQAVIHELPSRSPGFDIGFLLGEMFWNWEPCLVYCREPCKPEGWPERIKLAVGSPAIASDVLEAYANQVKLYVGMEGRVLRAGPRHITLPGELAVEALTKLFYLRDYRHELGEQATYWKATDLARKIHQNLEDLDGAGPIMVKHETLATDSFEERYKELKVEALDPQTNERLQLPRVFVRIRGIRWGAETKLVEPATQPEKSDPVVVELAGPTLDNQRFARLRDLPESQKLDFKSEPYRLDTVILKSRLIKDIASIANTNPPGQPGYILIGLENKLEPGKPRKLLGVANHPDDADLQSLVRDKLQPPPDFLYYPFEYETLTFGVFEIRSMADVHQCRRTFGELTEGQVYTRKGSRNSVAGMPDIEALLLERRRIFTIPAASPPAIPAVPEIAQQDTKLSERLRNAWARLTAPIPDRTTLGGGDILDPKTGEMVFSVEPGVRITDPAEDVVLGPGREVAVVFRSAPSRTWKDPSADILGLRPLGGQSPFTRLAQPLRFQRRDSDEAVKIGRGVAALCIPSFDVELEFRERSLVLGPVWSRVKEQVVRQFLAERRIYIARIVSLGSAQRAPYLLLHCDDYDRWLNDQWPFYRGIENALTETQSLKSPAILTMAEKDLGEFVARELIATGRLAGLVPETYRKAFENRPIDAESVLLVLRGLIQQELKFAGPGTQRI